MTETEIQELLKGSPLSFVCPTCNAPPNQNCVTKNDFVIYDYIHATRRRASGEKTGTPWGEGKYGRNGLVDGKRRLASVYKKWTVVPCEKCGARTDEYCKSTVSGLPMPQSTHSIRIRHAELWSASK